MSAALGVLACVILVPLAGDGSGSSRLRPRVAPAPLDVSPDLAGPARDGPPTPPADPFPRFLHHQSEAEAAAEAAAEREPRAVRELVLSFDDGPELEATPVILDELDRRGLKAVFFVTGRQMVGAGPGAQARRELIRQIAVRGHLVGNHTLTHADLCRHPESIAPEIDGNSELIAAATGRRPHLFRAPYGVGCEPLRAALIERELTEVGWNIDPQDWRGAGTGEIVAAVTHALARLPGRGILLLHDTHPQAVRALPEILDWIAAENRRGSRPLRIVNPSVFLEPAAAAPVAAARFGAAGLEALADPSPELARLLMPASGDPGLAALGGMRADKVGSPSEPPHARRSRRGAK